MSAIGGSSGNGAVSSGGGNSSESSGATLVTASGTVVASSGTVAASGTIENASGTVIAGSGTVISTSGTVISTSGTVISTSGTVISTSGTVISTSGTDSEASAGFGRDAALDAAPNEDNGMPSTSYPAPHAPLPQMVNARGGPVLLTPHVYLIFYPDTANQSALETFAQAVSTSTYWATRSSEYGVGALTYAGTTVLTGQPSPTTITSTQIQSWIGQEIAQGVFGTPDPQAIYTVVYPSTTTIQQPNPVSPLFGPVDSCSTFSAYHDNVSVALSDGGAPTTFAYAVIATCVSSIDDQTPSMSHEWIEASTDPQATASGAFTLSGGPNAAYFSVDSDDVVWAVLSSGGEAADLCQPEGAAADYTPNDIGYAVQRIWSNALAAASHDPCAPDLAGQPFFDSAPVLDETVTFSSELTGTITTKGVTIALGTSATIEVDLFSDAATSGPWTVTADDLLSRDYSSYGIEPSLSFQWDRTQGSNGEKLHLTISVTGPSIVGGAHAFVVTSTLGNRSYQWPGIVVE